MQPIARETAIVKYQRQLIFLLVPKKTLYKSFLASSPGSYINAKNTDQQKWLQSCYYNLLQRRAIMQISFLTNCYLIWVMSISLGYSYFVFFCFQLITELIAVRRRESSMNGHWIRAILGCQELKIADTICISCIFYLSPPLSIWGILLVWFRILQPQIWEAAI